MKPETAAHLRNACEFLAKARDMVGSWPDEAGRTAYLAGFHAAQALAFECTGRTPKTHRGLHSTFAQLVKHDPLFDEDHRRFLGRGYSLKAIADYGTEPGLKPTAAQSLEAIRGAERFVDAVTLRLASGPIATGLP